MSFLAAPMVLTAKWLVERRPGVVFVVPLVSAEVRSYFEREAARHGGGVDFRLVDADSRTAISAADVVLLASGTASLETMLLKRPMVITYRMTTITCFDTRIPNRAARGLVHAGLLAASRVSC